MLLRFRARLSGAGRPALLEADDGFPAEALAEPARAGLLLPRRQGDDHAADADHAQERHRPPHQPAADAAPAPLLPDPERAQLGPAGERGQAAAAREVWRPLQEADLEPVQLGQEPLARLVGDGPDLEPGDGRRVLADLGQPAPVQHLLVDRERGEAGAHERGRHVRPALGHAADDGHRQRGVARVDAGGAPAGHELAGGLDQGTGGGLRLGPEQQPRQLGRAPVAGADGRLAGVPQDVRGAEQAVLLDGAEGVPLGHPQVEVGVAGPGPKAAGDDGGRELPARDDASQVAVDQLLELLEMEVPVWLYGDHGLIRPGWTRCSLPSGSRVHAMAGARYSQPFSSAIRAASARLLALSFWMAAERWLRTVPSDRNRRFATRATLDPSADAASTSVSRLDSGVSPSVRAWAARCRPTTPSPATAPRIATASSDAGASLSMNPLAPAAIARRR